MKIEKRFTKKLETPYSDQNYVSRTSEIREPDGRVVFKQEGIHVPDSWSQVATDILAQKYFRRTGVTDTKGETAEGESDARQVFHRLAGCWSDWGERHGYFDSKQDAKTFYEEVCYMLSHQMAAPNSPQWFNTGLHFAYGIEGPPQGHFYVDPSDDKLKKSTSAYERPQPHACFIQSVDDDLVNDNGVMDLWIREARLFKYGSGTGTNFSSLRGKGEPLGGGGQSSGLMSFLRVGDRAAGAIKSGGTTRRAAKMVCLDLDHPEIEDFIDWKVKEEQKVSALVAGSRIHLQKLKEVAESCFDEKGAVVLDIEKNENLRTALRAARAQFVPDAYLHKVLQMVKMGCQEIDFPVFDVDWQSEAYETVGGQNANNSIRVSNRFFEALESGENWQLKRRTDGEVYKEISAEQLWEKIAFAAWSCADPGLQYDTTINEWHTCPDEGRINASNPCSEYMFLDDTACNLASINLLKFYDDESGTFDVEGFQHACRLWTVVLEISVLMAQFPSRSIAARSYEYRTLGLGYANLGALLMSMGVAYGSPKALGITGAITSILCGEAYSCSAEMAKELGAFKKYEVNKERMLQVIRNHRRAAYHEDKHEYEGLTITPQGIRPESCPGYLLKSARSSWDRALELGEAHGYRNAQVTVIAPTGTIGLVMDCDTTGIEPDFALVKFKKLAGGGYFRIINQSVPRALKNLGYTKKQTREIIRYCAGSCSLKGAPGINHETLAQKGFDKRSLQRIEETLPSAFDMRFVFNEWNLGADFLKETLKISEAQMRRPGFDLLTQLGFSEEEISKANRFVTGTMTLEGAPHLKEVHLPIFDCANRCGSLGTRYLPYQSHIDTMASAQPFISGAISKTINMPEEATLDEVKDAYLSSWKKMIKAVSIYRDGSKLSQPLSASASADLFANLGLEEAPKAPLEVKQVAEEMMKKVKRKELPKRRYGYTVKATIGGQRIYLRTGEYDDGQLGEVFIDMYKEGAAYRSLMNAFAIAVSMGLQHGVPLEEFVSKFHMFRFEPNGHVADHDHVKFCSSVIDFIFRDLALNYLGRTDMVHVPPAEDSPMMGAVSPVFREAGAFLSAHSSSGSGAMGGMQEVSASSGMRSVSVGEPTDVALTREEWDDDNALAAKLAKTQGYEGDPCSGCGQFTMVRSGTCTRCVSCGETSGCS